MGRRKYRFPNRATAEREYERADRGRLRVEWLLSAILGNRHKETDRLMGYRVGYVVLRHSVLVYAIKPSDGIHRVLGIWDVDDDELRTTIDDMIRSSDGTTHDLGIILDRARHAAFLETNNL